MELNCGLLPVGFRFHPTDEELITHYLSKKVVDSNFSTIAIGEVDMNNVEPWELPWPYDFLISEWGLREKKYRLGKCMNRSTAAGYWKLGGGDKEIFRENIVVGLRKLLVYYRGRAPNGERLDWLCHEYQLNAAEDDWVICKVFRKKVRPKGVHMPGGGNELAAAARPTDPSPCIAGAPPPPMKYPFPYIVPPPMETTFPCIVPPPMEHPFPYIVPPPMENTFPCIVPPPMENTLPCIVPPPMEHPLPYTVQFPASSNESSTAVSKRKTRKRPFEEEEGENPIKRLFVEHDFDCWFK